MDTVNTDRSSFASDEGVEDAEPAKAGLGGRFGLAFATLASSIFWISISLFSGFWFAAIFLVSLLAVLIAAIALNAAVWIDIDR